MNKINILLIGLLWALFQVSCSDRVSNTNGGIDPKNTTVVTVIFPGRILTPNTYGGNFPADITEKSITGGIRIFAFSDNEGQPGSLIASESVVFNPPLNGSENVEGGISGKFFMFQHGKFHFVATANITFDQEVLNGLKGKSFAEFSKIIVKQPAGTPNMFPMVSEPSSTITVPSPQSNEVMPKVSFLLERLSVRIDIENETSTEGGGLFELQGARLFSNIDRSFLIKNQDPALKIGESIYGSVALPSTWQSTSGSGVDNKKMYKQLYTYENVNNSLVVQVKGTFNGQLAQFDLPFGDRSVKRNTRYVVKIKNVIKNKMTYEIISVADWKENGSAEIIPDIDKAKPTITAITSTDATGKIPVNPTHTLLYSNGLDVNTATEIKLGNPEFYYTTITTVSPMTETMLLVNKADIPWVTIKEIERDITAGQMKQIFLITYGKNQDLYPRSAQLEIQNKFYPDKLNPHTININQPEAKSTANFLAFISKANLDKLNTFASDITEDNVAGATVRGKLYQFGRNIAFDHDQEIQKTNIKSNGNDQLCWSNEFISVNVQPFNWFEGESSSDTWNSIVAKATNAPDGYKGTNGGDPCPPGWRIPQKQELVSLFPWMQDDNTSETSINFKGNVSVLNKAEKINNIDYFADYYSQTPNIIYALKLRGGDNKKLTAYRYEYRGGRGIHVTSRLIGENQANITIQNISTSMFWSNNAYSDVVRLFPTVGIRGASGGYVGKGYEIWIWSDDTLGSSYSGSLSLNSLYVLYRSMPRAHGFSIRCIRNN